MARQVNEVIYSYKETGLPQINRKIQSHNYLLGQSTVETQKYNYVSRQWEKQTMQTTRGISSLNKGMGGLALRFVGYQLVLSQVMGAQQKLLEFIKESVRKFREFEKAVAEVSTILTTVGMSRLPAISAGMEVLSIQFGRAATDMAGGMYQILSAAFAAEDALRLLNTATRASVAGLSTVAQSVDIFTSVLNAYGMTVSQAATLSDLFFQTVVRGKLRYEDLGSALGYVTPIAANAGIEFKEIAGVFSTATRMGLHLDMVSRGLALGIQGLISPTEGVAKAAKKYNIEIGPLAVRTQGLTGMIQQLHDASEKYGSHIISELIPNMRSFRVFAAMTGDVGVAGLAEDMDLLTSSFGRTEEAMGKMMNTTSFMADVLEQNFEAIERSVGKSLTNIQLELERTKQAMIGGVGGIVEAFSDITPADLISGAFVQKLIGGFKEGADRVNDEIKDSMELIQRSAINAFLEMTEPIQEKSLFESLVGEDADIRNVVNSLVDVEQIIERIDIEREIQSVSAAAHLTVQNMMRAGATTGELVTVTEEYDRELRILTLDLFDSQRVYDDVTGSLDTFKDRASAITYTIAQLTIEQNNLKDAVGETDDEYDGALGIQLKYKEDVKSLEDRIRALRAGISGQTGDFSVLSQEMQDHIAMIKKQKDAYDDLSIAMQKNNLEMMKIQLKGMMRRRGMTRSEQKAIKKFQIDNTKIRIEQLGIRIDAQESAQSDSKTILDEELTALRNQLFDLKDTRQADIDSLRDTIGEKEGLLDASYATLKTQQEDYEELTEIHTQFIASLYTIMTDDIIKEFERMYGFSITEPLPGAETFAKEAGKAVPRYIPGTTERAKVETLRGEYESPLEKFLVGRGIGNFQRGIYRVPETMPAIVHRGEQIVPAGGQGGTGGSVTIYNEVHAVINNEMDARQLAELLAEGERSTLLKRGKTTVRVR